MWPSGTRVCRSPGLDGICALISSCSVPYLPVANPLRLSYEAPGSTPGVRGQVIAVFARQV